MVRVWWDDSMKAWLAAKLQTLDESIKQTIKKDKQCMEKTFKGFTIPPAVDTPEGRKCVREGYQLKRNYCFIADFGPCMRGWSCRDCIACINRGDAVRKHEVFKQYDREFPVETGSAKDTPDLMCGTVLKLSNGAYWLLEGPTGKWVRDVDGELCTTFLETCSGEVSIRRRAIVPYDRSGVLSSVVAIYANKSPYSGVIRELSRDDLYKILCGDAEGKYLIWKKPDPVKEMTVDEISKALGYKVKVVGSEKADD